MRTLVTALALIISCTQVRADKVVLFAGGAEEKDGIAAIKTKLNGPFGVASDKAGNFYVVEMLGLRVRRIDAKGVCTIIAGTGEKGSGGDGGPSLKAGFDGPHSLVATPEGDIYVADTWNNRVRKIDGKTGVITTVAGTGEKGFSGDGGPAVKAKFGGVYCVALDALGANLYIADLDNRRIRVVELRTGVVETVAGNGEKGVPEDGAAAVRAPLIDPRAVAVDAKDNVYILERGGNALRVVDAKGKIRTVVGTGKAGATGDGGDAKSALLNGPKHLCVDKEGHVLIADTENHLIRKYLPSEGKIVRVAGTGKKGSGGLGGLPEKAELDQPHGVYIAPDGALYVADSSNNRVLRIDKGE